MIFTYIHKGDVWRKRADRSWLLLADMDHLSLVEELDNVTQGSFVDWENTTRKQCGNAKRGLECRQGIIFPRSCPEAKQDPREETRPGISSLMSSEGLFQTAMDAFHKAI